MSKHKIEDYIGKEVLVWDGFYKHRRTLLGVLLGCGRAVAEHSESPHLLQSWQHWEPLPEEKPITVLDLMKAGMFYKMANLGICIVMDDSVLENDDVGQYLYHKDPTTPLDEWKKFEDLTWEDLK